MASNGQYPNTTPDLASILKTLATFTSQNQSQSETNVSSIPPNVFQPPTRQIEEERGNHHNPAPTLESFLTTASQVNSNSKKLAPVPKINIDPTSIVDWSAGLRHVMKTVARHEKIIDEIRRLIKIQHEHEEQWWNGRNAVIEKVKAREEGQKKLDEVLKAVGGVVSSSQPGTEQDMMARELQTFDLKVYKAQMQMVREMNAKLRALGVPFFGTRSDLVRAASKKTEVAQDDKGMIDEADLVKLQRRMLQILEDLCND